MILGSFIYYTYRSTEKANMFKQKRLIEKVGTSYLKNQPFLMFFAVFSGTAQDFEKLKKKRAFSLGS